MKLLKFKKGIKDIDIRNAIKTLKEAPKRGGNDLMDDLANVYGK